MSALTTSSTQTPSESNYISMHDQAELQRLNNLAAYQGLGEPIDYSDQETLNFLEDFGLSTGEFK